VRRNAEWHDANCEQKQRSNVGDAMLGLARLAPVWPPTKALKWPAGLLELLIEEMYIDDSLEELLGGRLRDLPRQP
jgi:hypothetical protein